MQQPTKRRKWYIGATPVPPTPSTPAQSKKDNPESLLCCLWLDELPMDLTKITRFTCCGSGVHHKCADDFRNSPMSYKQSHQKTLVYVPMT